ncbi:hypothetical protein [Actinoplanes sp. NPDC049118]|uniref:hypothetical protein n=1 Tax=Actinoplanes sp. NPDC049118 TaxID=3155769 RepID=UPI00340D8125
MKPRHVRTDAVEQAALVLILVVVGCLAGWASVGHVVDWTMAHVPAGTSVAYGRTNAAVSELVPIATLLVIRHRRRRGQTIRYPLALLLIASAFSLTAQLAVAKPGLSGWVVSAVPSLAFIGITKLVLSLKPIARELPPEPVPEPIREPTTPVFPVTQEPVPVKAIFASAPEPETPYMPKRGTAPAETGPALSRNTGQVDQATTTPSRPGARPAAPAKRVRPRSLTSAAKVEAAVAALPKNARVEDVAVKAGVSVSTARRYLPKELKRAATPAKEQTTPKKGRVGSRPLTVGAA